VIVATRSFRPEKVADESGDRLRGKAEYRNRPNSAGVALKARGKRVLLWR
jgi:hypothetical protein